MSDVDIWSQSFAASVQQQWAAPPSFPAHAQPVPPAAVSQQPAARAPSSHHAAHARVDEDAHVAASHTAALLRDCADSHVDLQALLQQHGVALAVVLCCLPGAC